MSERVSGDKNPGWQKFGDLNPNSKVSKEVASYIYFFTHSNKIFPKITRKQFLGKHNITVDIYKKIQQNRTWPNLRKEISLNDEDMYNKTLNFIETILSEAAIAERATTSENKLTCL